MSIEEKAKRYDEAYKVAKNIHIFSSDLAEIKRMEEIFPELKEESKGERIRKKICKLLWDNAPYEEAQEYIAWLEKQVNPTEDELEALRMAAYEPTKNWSEKLQSLYEKLTHCEQKPVIEMKSAEESLGIDSDTYNKIVDECIYGEQKPEGKTALEAAKEEKVDNANKIELKDYSSIDPHFFKTTDKVEPKFKIGDWVVSEYNNVCYIESINETKYNLQCKDGHHEKLSVEYIDRCWRLWTIQDAKPGDVLATENFIFIFKNIDNSNGVHYYCQYEISKHEDDNQFDIALPQSLMGRVGNSISHYSPATKEQRDLLFQKMKEAGYEWDTEKKELKKIEQKSTWSEEDERIYQSIMDDTVQENQLNDKQTNWLRDIKYRYFTQPKQEWSVDDERAYRSVLYDFEHHFPLNCVQQEFVKSHIQPQNTWKPSDEQMDELRKYSDNVVLRNLYYNLKKLKE